MSLVERGVRAQKFGGGSDRRIFPKLGRYIIILNKLTVFIFNSVVPSII